MGEDRRWRDGFLLNACDPLGRAIDGPAASNKTPDRAKRHRMASLRSISWSSAGILAFGVILHLVSIATALTLVKNDARLMVSDAGASAIIIFAAGLMIWRDRRHAQNATRGYVATTLVLGIWVLVSPLWLGRPDPFAATVEILTGLGVVALSVFELWSLREARGMSSLAAGYNRG
jgi:FtsH-binding integral membrane protein